MDYQTFLAKLRETPRDWKLVHSRFLRDLSEDHCPLTRVSGRAPMTIEQCASALSIDLRLAERIAEAADRSHFHDSHIRADLLAACGLTEKESA